jgi:hypothetical protein
MHSTRVILGHILPSFAERSESKPSTYVSHLPSGVVFTDSTGSSPSEVNSSCLSLPNFGLGLWHATRSVDRRPNDTPMRIAARGTRQLPRPSLVVGVVVLVCWLCPVSLCSGVVSSFRGDSAPLLRAPGSAFHSFAFVFANLCWVPRSPCILASGLADVAIASSTQAFGG